MESANTSESATAVRYVRLGVVGCVAMAAFIRVVGLGSIPPGLWYDEGLNGLDALALGKGHWPMVFTAVAPREPLFVYSLGLFFALFGHSVLKARLVSAIWGTLTVAVFYPFARRALGPRWALFATFAFAVFRWHVHFSRTVFRTVLTPLFILLVLVFFLRWRERKRTRDAVACGFFLGAGMYTYLSFRFVPVILVCWIAWLWWRGILVWRRDWRGIAVIHGIALLVFLPLGADYMFHPGDFSGRTSQLSMFRKTVEMRRSDGTIESRQVMKTPTEALAGLLGNAVDVAGMWTVRGDHVGKHNLPYAPVFDWLSGVFFYAGLAWCLYYAGRNEYAFVLLCWLLLMSLASVFSFGAPNLLRMQGATPAVAAIYVFGIRWLYGITGRLAAQSVRRAIAVALLAFFAAMQLGVYFLRFPKSLEVRREFQVEMFYDPAEAVRRIASSVKTVYVPEEMATHYTFAFVVYGLPEVVSYKPDFDLPTTSSVSRATALLATSRSQRLSAELGRDPLQQFRQLPGARPARRFDVTVLADGQAAGRAEWGELWVSGQEAR